MTIQEKITITSHLDELGSVRSFIRETYAKVPKKMRNKASMEKIILAVNEAVANIIKHAYQGKRDKKIELTADISANSIVIHLYDWGITFSPESVAPPKLDGSENGGFGIYIISKIIDKVGYFRDSDGRNCTRLEIKN